MRNFTGEFKGKRKVVFLDYDGTLAPIVDRPEDAKIDQETFSTVKKLSQQKNTHLVSEKFTLRGMEEMSPGENIQISVYPCINLTHLALSVSVTAALVKISKYPFIRGKKHTPGF